MIKLVSDHPMMLGAFERVPDAGLNYRFEARVDSRRFFSVWTSLISPSDERLRPYIEKYIGADDTLKQLHDDIYGRLKYDFRPNDYRPGGVINSSFSQTDRKELTNLQRTSQERLDAAVALTTQLLHIDVSFQRLGHLQEASGARFSSYFTHRKGWIWMSRRALTDEQWIALIDRKTGQENELLSRLAQGRGGEPNKRDRVLPIEVRHEVWRRDNGRCVNCGSQEHLEFDPR